MAKGTRGHGAKTRLCPPYDSLRSIPLMPLLADHRAAAREREQNLSADAGGGLAAAIGEKYHAEPRVGNHADIGRGDVEPAVLADGDAVAVRQALPGERLGEAIVHLEDALLRQRHRRLKIALLRQRAEIGGEKARHVARRGKNLPGARPGEYALVEAGLADGFSV